jgi:hypothetical protein
LEQVFFVVEMVATPILRQNLMHHRIEKTTSRISTFRIARFLLIQTYQKGKIISNGHTLYKITMPSNIPNGHKIYQHFTFQGPPKYIQVWIFCWENKPSGNPGFDLSVRFPDSPRVSFDGVGPDWSIRMYVRFCSKQARAGANVVITIFGDFCQFSAKKWAFFLEKQYYDSVVVKTSSILNQNAHFLGESFLRIVASVPGLDALFIFRITVMSHYICMFVESHVQESKTRARGCVTSSCEPTFEWPDIWMADNLEQHFFKDMFLVVSLDIRLTYVNICEIEYDKQNRWTRECSFSSWAECT